MLPHPTQKPVSLGAVRDAFEKAATYNKWAAILMTVATAFQAINALMAG
jgi:hypothetical protein